MLLHVAWLLAGFGLLYYGAEWLVLGAAGLARRFGVRPVVVGLTVVAYGTSAPEMIVSSVAAFEGNSAIALGNVVGSNIANLGLILAAAALLKPLLIEPRFIRRDLPIMLLASACVPIMLADGVISRAEAAVLIAGGLLYSWTTVRAGSKGGGDEMAGAIAFGGHKGKLGALTMAGLVVLVVGGKLFVDGAVGIANAIGVSQRVIGLTVVAIGTSLPELAASLMAAWKGHSSIAVGNLVGSNIFNVLFVLGVSGAVRPVNGALGELVSEMVALAGVSALTLLFLRGDRTMSRAEGFVLLTSYCVFVAYLAFAR